MLDKLKGKGFVVCDIETNGLLYDVFTVHILSIYDIDEGKMFSYYKGSDDGNIDEGLKHLDKANKIIGHNWAGYDAPVLNKLHGFKFDSSKVIDTMLLSNILNPDRDDGHSLDSYGQELGIEKPGHDDWAKLSDEMIFRNKEDVKITYSLFLKLLEDSSIYNIRSALQLEQQFAYIMAEQEANGWYIDKDSLIKLITLLGMEEIRLSSELEERLPLNIINYHNKNKDTYTYTGLTVKGEPATNAVKWIGHESIAGDFCKVSFSKIDLGSHKQVKDFLLSIGWKPTDWNYKKDKDKRFIYEDGEKVKTSPIITEESLDSLKDDKELGLLFRDRFVVTHRLSYLTGDRGVRTLIRDDGRIGAGMATCATNTSRVRHYGIVNVCSVTKPYGKAIRSLFTAESKENKLIGIDLSALEQRIAGHYTKPLDGGEYIYRLERECPHQHIADQLGIERPLAKKLNYMCLYGAQAGKVKEDLSLKTFGEAKQVLENWWEANPALLQLKEKLLQSLKDRDFIGSKGRLKEGAHITAIDDRPIFIRSTHSAINALFQSAGSICNKAVTVIAYNEIYKIYSKKDVRFIGNFHDENNLEVTPNVDTDIISNIFKDACNKVTKRYSLTIPLLCDIVVGANWFETH